MDDALTTISFEEFQSGLVEIVHKIGKHSEPVAIRLENGSNVIVQSAKEYQRIIERLDRLEFSDAVPQARRDIHAGAVRPAREGLAELQKKLGIPD